MLIGYFILFCKVLGVQLHLHQTEQPLTVSINETAKISCLLSEVSCARRRSVRWFWRGIEEEVTLIKSCGGDGAAIKYNCSYGPCSTTLQIHNVQQREAGVYYCAYAINMKLHFSSDVTLIVGDSYTERTSVLLVTLPPLPDVPGGVVPLACVVRAVSGQVWVSWNISGTQWQGLMSAIRGRGGTLTFISHIVLPMETWTRGEITCESQVNSSHRRVKKSLVYKAAPSGDVIGCVAAFVARTLLLLLTLSWILYRVYRSADKDQGDIVCAQHNEEEEAEMDRGKEHLTRHLYSFLTGTSS
ncbi:uncharacterized protein [Ambystoma mexicanum]|uniref:uncharacterized protein isoform X2 n=1 Tax=Ambystoma mexicanum TaxID=8296 RepID=UPI0037E95A88